MEELIKKVMKKTGLPEAKAKAAVDTVLKFVMDKVPAPVAEQIKTALAGGAPDLGAAAKTLGGLFGKKK